MKATSTYVNCNQLTSTEIQAKINQVKSRIETLNYIISNKSYTKTHRYDAVLESMILEGQLVYLGIQLQQKLQRESSTPVQTQPVSEVKVSNAPLRSRPKMHETLNPNLAVRHRLMTEKEKKLLQQQRNMYAFLDKYTLN